MTTPTDAELADGISLANHVATAGGYVLSCLGFKLTEPAEVKIDIGTDDDPDHARITLTWPLPPEVAPR